MDTAYKNLDKWPWDEAASEVRDNLARFKKGEALIKMGMSLETD